VKSCEGLHQGDPISLPLFALAIQAPLEKVVNALDNVSVLAFADNITFVAKVSQVPRIFTLFTKEMNDIGLQVNFNESVVYTPAWIGDVHNVTNSLLCQTSDGYGISVGDNISIPVVTQGFNILGAPFGTAEFQSTEYEIIIKDIRDDLNLLEAISSIHLRAKLLVYCVNTRFEYFLATTTLTEILPIARQLDEFIEQAVCKWLKWTHNSDAISLSEHRNALDQLRLPKAQGGWGLRSMEHTAPAAVLGSQLKFNSWIPTVLNQNSSAIFEEVFHECKYTGDTYTEAMEFVKENYQLPESAQPQRVENVEQERYAFNGLPPFQLLRRWPADAIPTQQQIASVIGKCRSSKLAQSLSGLGPAHSHRLQAVTKQKHKVDAQQNEIFHSPMGLMSIASFPELSSEAFLICTAIQCGKPIPSSLFAQSSSRRTEHDPYGDGILNQMTSRARIASHNATVAALTHDLSSVGLVATCKDSEIPRINDPRNPDAHGGIHIISRGVGSQPSRTVVLDVTIVHSAQTVGNFRNFKNDSIHDAELSKDRIYRHGYAPSIDFVPIAIDSFGRIGTKSLLFFWKIAKTLANDTTTSKERARIFNTLRLSLLAEAFEATAYRIMHGQILRSNDSNYLSQLSSSQEAASRNLFGNIVDDSSRPHSRPPSRPPSTANVQHPTSTAPSPAPSVSQPLRPPSQTSSITHTSPLPRHSQPGIRRFTGFFCFIRLR